MRDCVQPCVMSMQHASHSVNPHMWEMLCLVARTNLIPYVETATKAQKHLLDPQCTVSAECSPFHSVSLAVPVLPVEETQVGLLGVQLFICIRGATQ